MNVMTGGLFVNSRRFPGRSTDLGCLSYWNHVRFRRHQRKDSLVFDE